MSERLDVSFSKRGDDCLNPMGYRRDGECPLLRLNTELEKKTPNLTEAREIVENALVLGVADTDSDLQIVTEKLDGFGVECKAGRFNCGLMIIREVEDNQLRFGR